jgi:hypothetical protein
MKKKLFILLTIVLVSCVVIPYIFIPSTITVSSAVVTIASPNGAGRYVLNQSGWSKWWNSTNNHFVYQSDTFLFSNKFFKSVNITILHGRDSIKSRLDLLPLQEDTTGIQWSYSFPSSQNPFKRIEQYQDAGTVKKNMDGILLQLKSFLDKPENIYNIAISRTSTKDTILISTKSISSVYPGTPAIYHQIEQLKTYIASQHARQTGNPIYNITQLDHHQFQLMTAIPVDKILPDNGSFAFKRMIPGSFMVTEVTGGEQTVSQALQNLLLYFADYHKTSMAINFQMLVTDRLKEPDTSKWVTRIYQPVY